MKFRPLAATALALLVGPLACSVTPAAVPPALDLPVPTLALARPAEAPAATPPSSARPPETFDVDAIDAWVARRVADQHLVGLSLAIVRNGKIALAKGYGQASRETGAPVDTSTAFAIGSVTKQFTCASALLLEQEGKLSLSQRLARYYPALPHAKEITLADLGGHTSGYADYYPLDFFDSRMAHAITADDLIARYAREPLDFAPRTRWSYSNTGFVILGRIVEKASGQPFGAFLDKRIFKPLGMDHASFAPRAGTPGLATGYESFALSEPRPAPREPEAWLFSAGAVYASATDLAKWDIALADGKVLRPSAYREMTTARSLTDERSTMYGCGLAVTQTRGETILAHGGEVNGFLAQNGIVPRTRSAVVVLTNSQFGDPSSIYRTLLSLVVSDGASTAKPPVVRGPSAKAAAVAMLHQLQAGVVDRSKLGAEFSLFMTDERVRDAAARLAPLGEASSVEAEGPSERGGMEVTTLHFSFATTRLDGWLYRSPDGMVQEFLVFKP